MRPWSKKAVELFAKTPNVYSKCTQKGLPIVSTCIINVEKTEYPTFKDNNPKRFPSENQRLV